MQCLIKYFTKASRGLHKYFAGIVKSEGHSEPTQTPKMELSESLLLLSQKVPFYLFDWVLEKSEKCVELG